MNYFTIMFFVFILFNSIYGQETARSIKAPYIKDGDSIFFTGDFLYWSTQIDGLKFSQSQRFTQNLSSSWSPGFRVGTGAILPHDKWEIFFEYTRIQNKQTGHAGANCILGSAANSSKAIKTQTFNNLDITLGRSFIPSRTTLFFPFIGLKGTYDTWHYNTHYQQLLPGNIIKNTSDLSVKMHQRFWGIGILAGFNSEWLLIKYLRLFGNFYIAGVSSHFNNSRQDILTYKEAPNNPISFVNTNSHLFTVQAMFDLELGLKTDIWFSNDRYHLSLQAGWELQTWLNQNHMTLLSSSSSSGGNLSFQGLTLKARFDF